MHDFVKASGEYLELVNAGYTSRGRSAARLGMVAGTITDFANTEKAWREGTKRTPNGIDGQATGKIMKIMLDMRAAQAVAYITSGVRP